jgi:hypothetical protein
LLKLGAEVVTYDSYVAEWWERSQDAALSAVTHYSHENGMFEAAHGADVVIFGVDHEEFKEFDLTKFLAVYNQPVVIIDAYNVLNDNKIVALLAAGHKVYGYGKGHIGRLEQQYAPVSEKDGGVLADGSWLMAHGGFSRLVVDTIGLGLYRKGCATIMGFWRFIRKKSLDFVGAVISLRLRVRHIAYVSAGIPESTVVALVNRNGHGGQLPGIVEKFISVSGVDSDKMARNLRYGLRADDKWYEPGFLGIFRTVSYDVLDSVLQHRLGSGVVFSVQGLEPCIELQALSEKVVVSNSAAMFL